MAYFFFRRNCIKMQKNAKKRNFRPKLKTQKKMLKKMQVAFPPPAQRSLCYLRPSISTQEEGSTRHWQ